MGNAGCAHACSRKVAAYKYAWAPPAHAYPAPAHPASTPACALPLNPARPLCPRTPCPHTLPAPPSHCTCRQQLLHPAFTYRLQLLHVQVGATACTLYQRQTSILLALLCTTTAPCLYRVVICLQVWVVHACFGWPSSHNSIHELNLTVRKFQYGINSLSRSMHVLLDVHVQARHTQLETESGYCRVGNI